MLRDLRQDDRDAVHEALTRSAAFSAQEIRTAMEMVDAGLDGDYLLPAIEVDGIVRGYACVGAAPLTADSWYLYWICVHPDAQRRGIGRRLQAHAEERVRATGGGRIVIETSGRPDYERTRQFYRCAGYVEVGRIPDFFTVGDDCVVFSKSLRDTGQALPPPGTP